MNILRPEKSCIQGLYTVSRKNRWASNTAKSMTLEGNSALLPAIVDRRPPLQTGLMNFQLIANHYESQAI